MQDGNQGEHARCEREANRREYAAFTLGIVVAIWGLCIIVAVLHGMWWWIGTFAFFALWPYLRRRLLGRYARHDRPEQST